MAALAPRLPPTRPWPGSLGHRRGRPGAPPPFPPRLRLAADTFDPGLGGAKCTPRDPGRGFTPNLRSTLNPC